MSLLTGFNVSLTEVSFLAEASIAAFVGGSIPAGWTVITAQQLGLAPQYQDGNYFTDSSSGASAIVLQQGTSYVVAFRGTDGNDDISHFPELAFGGYINHYAPLLSAIAANAPAGTNFYFTGASLGGGATNQMADIAASQYGGKYASAKFVALASPNITNSNGILNIGLENDVVYKGLAGYGDFASTLDNLVLASPEYMAGNYDGQHPFDTYAHSVGSLGLDILNRMANSVFFNVMSPTSVVVFAAVDNGLVQDITPGRENTGAFYLGQSTADQIAGRNGNDYIEGFAGNDVLSGGAGDDHLDGGTGADTMTGGTGNDTYAVDQGGDTIIENANEGTDTVLAMTGFSIANMPNVENLTLLLANSSGVGNALANTIIGTTGGESLDGGAGADTLIGGAGNDTYFVDNVGDQVVENANEGIDTVNSSIDYNLPANVENLVMLGSADLQGYGNALANTLTGNSGNNLLNGGAGADVMYGGAGNDVYFADGAGDTPFENANEGNDSVFASVSFTLGANVENLILQGSADLQGYGNSLANTVYGNVGNNLLNGFGGVDLMAGGTGDDVYFADDPSDAAFEVANQGNDTVFATCSYGLAADVENLILQGSGDFQAYGNGQANTIYGNSGNNLINGGAGADLMAGGAGNDIYFADDSSDAAFEVANQGNDSVFATCSYGLAAEVENLILQGSGDFQAYGNGQANTIYGNSGNNLINGGGAADLMAGGAGGDVYFADNASDAVLENANEGADAVFASVSFALSANVEALVLQGGGNLLGTGNTLANNIYGNAGDNTLDGRGGADQLTGSGGNDTFVFNVGETNGDTVIDFAGNGVAAGDSLQFVGFGAGATFTNINATTWQVNYNGGTSHEMVTFNNSASIDASDFLFL